MDAPRDRKQGGFAYLGLLILLAIMGAVGAASVQLGSAIARREAEASLLDIGQEFAVALERYREMTPSGQAEEPTELSGLIRDNRFPGVVRHLRKIYADPLTGNTQWGIVRGEDGRGIVGIYSLAQGRPIRTGNFSGELQGLSGSESYQQWVFSAELAEAGKRRNGEIEDPQRSRGGMSGTDLLALVDDSASRAVRPRPAGAAGGSVAGTGGGGSGMAGGVEVGTDTPPPGGVSPQDLLGQD